MTPEERELLNRSVELSEENNKMLHKIRSVQRWAAFWQTLKILVIVGIAMGSFYYLEPYLNKIIDLYNTVSKTQQKIDSSGLQNLLKKF